MAADRNRPQKHAERAGVVLASAAGGPVQHVAALLGVSRPMVWRWQQRFAEAGVDGLLRDKTGGGERWGWWVMGWKREWRVDGRGRTVQRIWEAHRLQPHRVRTFKRSRDPEFAAKPRQLPFDRRPASRHQALPRRTQRRAEAVRLDRISRLDPRQTRQAGCIDRISQSTSG